jgi:hypothetical protein
MRSTTFRNVALGILALALAYAAGARSSHAQAPGNPIVAVETGGVVYASNDDVYQRTGGSAPYAYSYYGNVFGGGPPTPAQTQSLGQVKARYVR